MRNRIGLGLALCLVAGCTPADSADQAEAGVTPSAPTLSAADSAAIQAINDRIKAAGRASDWNAWMADYTADAIRMPPNNPPLRDRAAIDEFHAAFPKVTAFDFTVEYLVGRGDLAVEHGTYTLSTEASASMPAMSEDGKFMTVFMEQADGSWKIVRDMWNSNKPLPTQ